MNYHRYHPHHRNAQGAGKLGLFIAGVFTALVAGGYYLYGPKGRENRERVDQWVVNAKREVRERVEQTRELTKEKFDEIVNEVTLRYAELKEVGKEKADQLKEEFEHHWSRIEAESQTKGRKGKEKVDDMRRKLADRIDPDGNA